ncbi:MAG: hypothetical protein JWM55_1556 [Acidimicrobiaceae bacterium]|nr:hypothetical protein [Acidimicrobiaceae bacterium]
MARFRSKSCPDVINAVTEGAGEVCGSIPGERELPGVRTDTAAGRCGVKDQVSTRSPFLVPWGPVG